MVGDESFRDCVVALWALLGASRAGTTGDLAPAAVGALAAVQRASEGESHLLLHDVDGTIAINGRRLPLGVEIFAATRGLASMLRAHDTSELLFARDVTAADLVAWAKAWRGEADGADPEQVLLRHGVRGIHAGRRCVAAGGEPTAALRRAEARPEAGDSGLRALFLQHQLMGHVGVGFWSPLQAKVVVQGVVDQLLSIPGGLEPLMLLQRDPAVLGRGLRVAIVTVLCARVVGWPDARLAELAASAALHGVGELVDASRPEAAGFLWFLQRGPGEFWLRCAIVAHGARTPPEGALGEPAALGIGAAALVAFARGLVLAAGDGRNASLEALVGGTSWAGGALAAALGQALVGPTA